MYGLIYDQSDRIFYIVESKSYLTEDGISKTVAKISPIYKRAHSVYYGHFFDADSDIVANKKGEIAVSVFLGYHSIEDDFLLTEAAAKKFTF